MRIVGQHWWMFERFGAVGEHRFALHRKSESREQLVRVAEQWWWWCF
jgi:hypothetical protein